MTVTLDPQKTDDDDHERVCTVRVLWWTCSTRCICLLCLLSWLDAALCVQVSGIVSYVLFPAACGFGVLGVGGSTTILEVSIGEPWCAVVLLSRGYC